MANCDKFISQFTDYFDGTLSNQLKSEFEQHIQQCSECAAKLQHVKEIRAQLKALTPVKTSNAFHIVLRSRIRRELDKLTLWEKVASYFKPSYIPAYTASLVAVFLIVYISFNNFFQTEIDKRNASPTLISSSEELGKSQSEVVLKQNQAPVEERILFVLDEIPEEHITGYRHIITPYSKRISHIRKSRRVSLNLIQGSEPSTENLYQQANAVTITF